MFFPTLTFWINLLPYVRDHLIIVMEIMSFGCYGFCNSQGCKCHWKDMSLLKIFSFYVCCRNRKINFCESWREHWHKLGIILQHVLFYCVPLCDWAFCFKSFKICFPHCQYIQSNCQCNYTCSLTYYQHLQYTLSSLVSYSSNT